MPDPATDQILQSARQYFDQRRDAEALAELRRLLALHPDHPEALQQAGICHFRLRQFPEAEKAFRALLQLKPDYPPAINNLGVILVSTGRGGEAVALFARAAELKADDPVTLLNLANAYSACEQHEAAIAAYRRCLTLDPNIAPAHQNLAFALRALGRMEESVAYYNQAAALQPRNADLLDNFATSLRDVGRYDEALDAYRRALKVDPNHASAHWNLSLVLLLKGNFTEGWREYEWRLRAPDSGYGRLCGRHPALAAPAWDGANPSGKRIFVYAEQAYGDTLQFARYLPLLARQGAVVTFACHRALLPLLKTLDGVQHCRLLEEAPPEFDAHCPLMNLPLLFKTTLETIPANVPYVKADAEKAARWGEKLSADAKRKIGIVWAGRRKPDPRRSLAIGELAPLAAIPDVHWISLQKGETSSEARRAPAGMAVSDWTNELNDFSDTAALMSHCDLLITVDTAAAHLAGAMGKPVLLLLPRFPTWRWMLNRSDSPWYPSMRIYRQEKAGDWRRPLEQVVQELRQS